MNRRWWGALIMAAVVSVAVLVAWSPSAADPNTETTLPADGVLSIEREDTTWTVTTDGVPSELKVMSPFNRVVCGVNSANLNSDSPDWRPLCTTVTTFTAPAGCVYIQVDGLPGYNSSDPYVCRPTVTPTESPSSTPSASEPPTTPTSTPTGEPTSTSTPSEPPTTPTSSPPSPPVLTDGSSPSPLAKQQGPKIEGKVTGELADTGTPWWMIPSAIVAGVLIWLGIFALTVMLLSGAKRLRKENGHDE